MVRNSRYLLRHPFAVLLDKVPNEQRDIRYALAEGLIRRCDYPDLLPRAIRSNPLDRPVGPVRAPIPEPGYSRRSAGTAYFHRPVAHNEPLPVLPYNPPRWRVMSLS